MCVKRNLSNTLRSTSLHYNQNIYCATDLFDRKSKKPVKAAVCSSLSHVWDWIVLCYISLTLALCIFGKIVIWESQLEVKSCTDLTRWKACGRDRLIITLKCLIHKQPVFKYVVIMRKLYAQKKRKICFNVVLAFNPSSQAELYQPSSYIICKEPHDAPEDTNQLDEEYLRKFIKWMCQLKSTPVILLWHTELYGIPRDAIP